MSPQTMHCSGHAAAVAVGIASLVAVAGMHQVTELLASVVLLLMYFCTHMHVYRRWVSMEDDRKYNREALEALLRARLISLPELDALAAKALLQGRSQVCCTGYISAYLLW